MNKVRKDHGACQLQSDQHHANQSEMVIT